MVFRPFSGRTVAVLSLAFVLAGCSSAPVYPGSTPTTTVVVNNANTTFNAMTVHLVTPAGIRVPLGEVSLNESRSFSMRRSLKPGDYRLRAMGTRHVTSGTFHLQAGDVMVWDLRRNQVHWQGKTSNQ